jgi:hypothetical protein
VKSIQERAGGRGAVATEGRRVARHGATKPGTPGEVVLTIGEVGALAGVVLVAAIATWSLALAQLGHHDGWLATGLGLLTTGIGGGVVLAVSRRPRIRFDLAELGLLAAVVAAGAFFFLPGFHYAYADKDPGVYVAHGFAIAREGDVYIDDPVLERGLNTDLFRGSRFQGIWIEPDHPNQVTSQFFHLYSSLLATADDLGGPRLLFNLNPLLAVASCCLVVLATRRAAGTVVAAVTGALLVTSMMQVWQAKYPSTEILAQLLLSGALLAAVLAIDRRWAAGAFVAGVLLGTGFLARPDGFLYVLLTAGAIAIIIAAGRADVRVAALIGGLAVSLPYAMWNAYVARELYTEVNSVPGPVTFLGVVVLAILGGWVARRTLVALGVRFPRTQLGDPAQLLERWRIPLGVVTSLGYGAVLVVLYFRRDIFGEDYAYTAFTDSVVRSLAEMSMPWLSWFITIQGLVIMWLGLSLVLVRRWRAPLFALVATGALLLPLYLYNPRVSMRLMWWVRRFIPAVVPVIFILMAIAIGWALTRRSKVVRVGAAVVLATLLVEYARMSLPLRSHDEMGGSWDLSAAIAAQARGGQGVFLFTQPSADYNDVERNAPAIVWFVFDKVVARLPPDYDVSTVAEYQQAFPELPIFVVIPGESLPRELPAEQFTRSGTVAGDVVIWEESVSERPDQAIPTRWVVTVWQLTGQSSQRVDAPSAE